MTAALYSTAKHLGANRRRLLRDFALGYALQALVYLAAVGCGSSPLAAVLLAKLISNAVFVWQVTR